MKVNERKEKRRTKVVLSTYRCPGCGELGQLKLRGTSWNVDHYESPVRWTGASYTYYCRFEGDPREGHLLKESNRPAPPESLSTKWTRLLQTNGPCSGVHFEPKYASARCTHCNALLCNVCSVNHKRGIEGRLISLE